MISSETREEFSNKSSYCLFFAPRAGKPHSLDFPLGVIIVRVDIRDTCWPVASRPLDSRLQLTHFVSNKQSMN